MVPIYSFRGEKGSVHIVNLFPKGNGRIKLGWVRLSVFGIFFNASSKRNLTRTNLYSYRTAVLLPNRSHFLFAPVSSDEQTVRSGPLEIQVHTAFQANHFKYFLRTSLKTIPLFIRTVNFFSSCKQADEVSMKRKVSLSYRRKLLKLQRKVFYRLSFSSFLR